VKTRRNGLNFVMVLVFGLSAAGAFAANTQNRWTEDSNTSYIAAVFGPIEGTWSWGVVDAARSVRCRNDSAFVVLLESLDPVQPDKEMVWEAIAIITEKAAALAAADIDTTGLTPDAWREQYPLRARYITHSGHWWEYWNHLAQLARLAYSDPLLMECLYPQVLDLFIQMECAFMPFLVVPPDYYYDLKRAQERAH